MSMIDLKQTTVIIENKGAKRTLSSSYNIYLYLRNVLSPLHYSNKFIASKEFCSTTVKTFMPH